MAPNPPTNASRDERPKDLKTVWIAPARPEWESMLLAVSQEKRIFLRVGRYNKDTKDKKWLGVELAPASLHALVKAGQESLKLIQEV